MSARVWVVENRVYLKSGRRKWVFDMYFTKRKHAIGEIQHLVADRGYENKNLRVAKYVRSETP